MRSDMLGPLSDEQFWELNDALNEVIGRMLSVGITPQELNYRSLEVMWGLQKTILAQRLSGEPDWVPARDAEIQAFMAAPRVVEHADVSSRSSSRHH